MEINHIQHNQAGDSLDALQFDAFLLKPRADRMIRITVNRNTLIAIVLSLLIHALVLLVILPRIHLNNAAAPAPTSLQVSLAPPPHKVEEPVLPKPPDLLEPKPAKQTPKAVKPPPKVISQKPSNSATPPAFSVPEVMTTTQPMPEPPPKEVAPNDAPTDMASYIKAQQAKRSASEADAARQNAEAIAREMGPSQDQIRDERIKNSFKNGTNGIFEITSLSGRHAAFAFKGWTSDYSNARREFFEVEASTGQDVRRLLVKKMISLIRQHYEGDFNWESQRLGRMVVQSARLEDSAGLEEFMMMEFFGSHYKNALP